MAKQVINVGASNNDKTGDKLRDAFIKVNANFTELYSAVGADVAIPVQTGNSGKYLTTNGTTLSWGTVSSGTDTGVIRFNSNTVHTSAGQNMVINPSNDSLNKIVIPGAGNGVAFPLSLTNTEGSVTLTANTKTWTVSTDGYLTGESLYLQGYLKGVDGSTGSTGQVLTRQSNGGVAWADSTSGTSYDQSLNTTDIVSFSGVNTGLAQQQGTQYVSVGGTPNPDTAVVFTAPKWMTSIKLVISIEGFVDGDMTYTDHTQTCEATIAASYNNSAEPVMSVYGLVHTSLTPLATFTVQRGVGDSIEVVATNTQTNNPLRVKVHAINLVSYFD
jgi:hypothetical protein